MVGPMRFGGHSSKRPPKKCTVCHKPLLPQMLTLNPQCRCECKRCLHNIIEGKREPGVCDDCKDEG